MIVVIVVEEIIEEGAEMIDEVVETIEVLVQVKVVMIEEIETGTDVEETTEVVVVVMMTVVVVGMMTVAEEDLAVVIRIVEEIEDKLESPHRETLKGNWPEKTFIP